jgi:signal transduction histidine kinase/DNA-binding response OmpR family regulator/CHASE3 domain sensor protein
MIRSRIYRKVFANSVTLIVLLTIITAIILVGLNRNHGYFISASSDTDILTTIEEARSAVMHLSEAASEYGHTGSPTALLRYGGYSDSFTDNLSVLRTKFTDDEAQSSLDRIEENFRRWKSESGNVIIARGDRIRMGASASVTDETESLFSRNPFLTDIRTQLDILHGIYATGYKNNLDDATALNRNLGLYIKLANILFAVFALLLAFILTRSIIKPISLLKSGTKKLSEGTFTPLSLDRNDEFGQLAEDFNAMSAMIGVTYTKLNAYSELVTALNSSSVVRDVASRSLDILCNHTDAAAGALYVKRAGTDTLKLVATYSLDRETAALTEFDLGEGIPGRCAKERKMIELKGDDTESGFLIRTGVADIVPRHVVAAPIMFKDTVLGVIVFCSATGFKAMQKDIILNSVPQIGVALTNAKNYETTQRLSLEVAEKNKELYDKNQELVKAYKVKSDFLAGMSHELRTPLNAIIGFSSVLLAPDADPISLDQRQALEKILKNGKLLLQLINDILDISKLESGKMNITVDSDDVRNIVTYSIATVEPLFNGKNIAIEHHIPYSIVPLETDILKVKQILINLLSNAVKFTERGLVSLTVEQQNGHTAFRIKDTGLGIDQKHIGFIFEEFRQIDSSSSRKHKGTGLGLPISRRLAHLLGGDISVTSEPGSGSEFTLTLPTILPQGLRKSATQPRPPASSEPNTMVQDRQVSFTPPKRPVKVRPVGKITGIENGTRVLCIDDDPDAIDLLRKYLAAEGFSVSNASTGTEGIRKAIEEQPALITLDIMLPDKDGWQVLRELKQNTQTAKIPVIIHSIIDNQPLAVSLGAIDIMPKPVDLDKLLSLVQENCRAKDQYVLIVDDNVEFSLVMKELIEQDGYTVKAAHDGEQALAIVRESRPAIIFLDLVMPGMDGFEVVKRLKQNDESADIPVVILSGKALSSNEKGYLQSNIQDYFKKEEFSHESIIKSIKRILTPAA